MTKDKKLTTKEKLEFLNKEGFRCAAWDEDGNDIEEPQGLSDKEINHLYKIYIDSLSAPTYDWKVLRDMSEEDKKKLPKNYNTFCKGEEHEEYMKYWLEEK